MKLNYEYRVHRVEPSGWATVEYKNESLGSITRVLLVPYDKGEEAIRRKIIQSFPLDLFYSRYLQRSPSLHHLADTHPGGSMSVDFDDAFYDVMELTA